MRSGWVLAELRLPRLVMALLSGAGLAVSGCVLQALLRNDLATPYTLGISAGAALTAGTVIVTGVVVPAMGMVLAGTAGSLAAVLAVYLLAGLGGRGRSGTSILLAGVTMNLVGASVLLLMEYLADATRVMEIVRWMMGDLSVVGWSEPLFLLPLVAAAAAFSVSRGAILNQLALGEDLAASRGVPVTRERRLLLASAAVLAGAVVGVIGPVGFVGLIVPHAMRRLAGEDYRVLLPASALGGALLMTLADALSRMVLSPAELPVGVVTALTGGPFFLVLLLGSGGPGGSGGRGS